MSLTEAALLRALADVRAYRAVALAAIDQLAQAEQQRQCQARTIEALRLELRERMGVPDDLR